MAHEDSEPGPRSFNTTTSGFYRYTYYLFIIVALRYAPNTIYIPQQMNNSTDEMTKSILKFGKKQAKVKYKSAGLRG